MQLEGNWNLQVETPFGTYPATLRLERAGAALNGTIDSQVGSVPLRDLQAGADGFEATAAMEVKGRTYEANVSAQVAGERIEGRINVKFPFAPTVKFSGTRAAA